MRIRDWSSDVCSSDLGVSSLTACAAALGHPIAARNDVLTVIPAPLDDATIAARLQATAAAAILQLRRHGPRIVALPLGRAAGRESVCPYEYVSGVAGSLKINTPHIPLNYNTS